MCLLASSRSPRVAAEAVTALGMIGIKTESVQSALAGAAKRKERNIAARAAATLKMFQRER